MKPTKKQPTDHLLALVELLHLLQERGIDLLETAHPQQNQEGTD